METPVIMTQTSHIKDESNKYIHLPFIHIEPLDFNQELLNHDYHWLLFSSKNAVKFFLPYLKDTHFDKVAVIGNKTKQFCETHDIKVDFCPSDFSQEGFIKEFDHQQGEKILIPSSAAARPLLVEQLKQQQMDVTKIDLYHPIPHKENIQQALSLLQKHKASGVAFASSSAAKYFFDSAIDARIKVDFKFYAIGKPTYLTIKANGYEAKVAHQQTIESLMKIITESRNPK